MSESHPGLRSARAVAMANRSDRHSPKPATCRAFEAATPIRHECADSHRGLGQQSVMPRKQAAYTTATGFLLITNLRCRALVGRGPYMTRHSSPDEDCLQYGRILIARSVVLRACRQSTRPPRLTDFRGRRFDDRPHVFSATRKLVER